MKYSNTALKELKKRYKNILLKCALINAIALAVSVPAMATELNYSWIDSGDQISINKDININTDSDGIVVISKDDGKYNGTQVNINTNTVSITTSTTDDDYGAIWVQTRTAEKTPPPDSSRLDITADSISISSGRNAVVAMSNGIINLSGNTSITGENAIVARGYANININTEGTASTIVNGDVNFDYDEESSGSVIEAYVNLNLTGTDSVWTGNTTRSWSTTEKPNDNTLGNLPISNGLTLTLNDGAVWNATKITPTNNLDQVGIHQLTINKGRINVQEGAIAKIQNTTVNGDLTLNGKITGGSVEFKDGSSLTTTLDDSVKISADTVKIGNASLNLILDPSVTSKTYNFIESNDISGSFNIADNGLYSFKQENGKIIAKEKSSAEIAQKTGISGQNADALLAIIDANKTNGKGGALANALSNAMQTGNAGQAVQAAKEAAPTDSQFIAGIAKETANTLANVSLVRMDSIRGTAGGDVTEGAGIWGQGLYNHTKQDATTRSDGFSADSRGFALGADKEFSDSVLFGMGYAFMNTDADSFGRDIKVNSHNIFAYGKYQPSQWYICSILNYNVSKYKEKKAPMGVMLRSEYNVNSYGGQVMTGYVFKNGIRPYVGLRYLFVDADSYYDGLQRVHSEKEDVLTSLVGIKYSTSVKAKDIIIRPTARIAATYDVLSENTDANISVIGGNNYQIEGNRLHRFGIETVIGATASIDNVDITLEYNGAFRQDYKSQGGILRARYNF